MLWSPQSAPVPGLNNNTFRVTVPAVVGGGSVVNGMGYVRGSKSDYDSWKALGNPGWGWDDLLPYFKKSTTFQPPSEETTETFGVVWDEGAYGTGPVHVHVSDWQYTVIGTIWDALRGMIGFPKPNTADGGQGRGAFWTGQTIDARTQTRETARSAYYDPVQGTRGNLRLATGQIAQEILFHMTSALPKAKGVKIVSREDGIERVVFSSKEVILAAGAIQTPQLLQASGIGPADVLTAAGIPVRKNLPSVGANLQDHPTTLLLYLLANETFPSPNTIFTNATYNETVWNEYLVNKTGPVSTANTNTVAFFSLADLTQSTVKAAQIAAEVLTQNPLSYLPFIYHSSPELLAGYLAQRTLLAAQYASPHSRVSSSPLVGSGAHPAPFLKPLSRGTVTLDPEGGHLPIVQYNTLQNPIDGKIITYIVRNARRFWETPAMQTLQPRELVPGVDSQSDEDIMAYLRSNPGIFWPSLAHPVGTCAMMPEVLGGCVGPDLKVYGVKGVRVVDASIMPIIVAGGLQATVYAVAEKAADLIRGIKSV